LTCVSPVVLCEFTLAKVLADFAANFE